MLVDGITARRQAQATRQKEVYATKAAEQQQWSIEMRWLTETTF
jgi:hypothetical protein